MSLVFDSSYFKDDNLEEGSYTAEFIGYEVEEEVETKYGKRDRFVLRFDVDGMHIVEKCLKSKYRSSKLYRFIAGMSAGVINEFKFDDYIGQEFTVEIANNTDDKNRIWSNIVDIEAI